MRLIKNIILERNYITKNRNQRQLLLYYGNDYILMYD